MKPEELKGAWLGSKANSWVRIWYDILKSLWSGLEGFSFPDLSPPLTYLCGSLCSSKHRSKLLCLVIKTIALAKSGSYLVRILLFCFYLCKVTCLKLLLLGKDIINNGSITGHQTVPWNASNRVIFWSKHVWSKSSALGCLHLTVSAC